MIADEERALFGSTRVLCTILGAHIVENGRIVPEPIQDDLGAGVWVDAALHMGKLGREEYSTRIFRIPSPDKIILNTNRNVDKPIRLFSNSEQTQDTIDNWDPMRLSGMFSDNAESKDVLETLDDLRDRLR